MYTIIFTICPSKARFNFVQQSICELKGASFNCLRETAVILEEIHPRDIYVMYEDCLPVPRIKIRTLSH